MDQNQTEQKTTEVEKKTKVESKKKKEKFKHVDEAVGVGSDATPHNEEVKPAEKVEAGDKKKSFTAMLKEATTVDDLVRLYNDMVPTAVDLGFKKVGPVQMFVDLATGKLACTKLHERIQKSVNQTEKKEAKMAKKAKSKAKKAARSSARGPRVSLSDDSKITWVSGKKNPYREGTGAWKRTEAVRTNSGQTVKSLRSKKVKSGTIRTLLRSELIKAS